MNTRICFGLAVGIALVTGSSVRAQCCDGGGGPTEVGGLICQDRTWDCSGSPYIVVNSIIVGCDATLTIEPGVEVRFKSNLGLTVGHITFLGGTLVARGTGECPILFTSNAPYEAEPAGPAPGDWARIYFTDYAIDAEYDEFGEYVSGCVLEHVIVEYASSPEPEPAAITGDKCSPYLAHCALHNNLNRAIRVTSSGAGAVKIEDCAIRDNGSTGISVDATDGRTVSIARCQIHDPSRGIYVRSGGFLVSIEDCEIARAATDWHGAGILLEGMNLDDGRNHIVRGNLVEDCSATGTGNYEVRAGGGIYINTRTTLEGNIVRNNTASSWGWRGEAYGGGIYLDSSSDGSTLSNNVVSGNSAGGWRRARGGGIHVWASNNCTLASNTVSDNTTNYSSDWDSHGGGIYLNGSNCVLTGNTVTGNITRGPDQGKGGGVFLDWSPNSILTSNTITGNVTHAPNAGGGGVFLWESRNCLIQDNIVAANSTYGQYAHGGGIYLYNSSTGTGMHDKGLWDNTISDNVTTGTSADGGGIELVGSPNTHLESNIITGNITGDDGGGILFWNSGQWILRSNVITGNTAAREGGGIYIGQSGCAEGDPRCTMTDTVVARNHTNGDTGGIYVLDSTWVSFAGDPETCTYNCICDNDGYCVYNDNEFDAAGSGDIDARHVIWCTENTQDIENCIYDFFDDANLGIVVWYPFVAGDCENWDWPAWRDLSLPDPLEPAYKPGVAKEIRIQISPPVGAETVLLEDTPPAGWTVSDISDGGVWDAINQKVKWGPWVAPAIPPTTVHYSVTPLADADGEVCFAGTISIDGQNLGICGDKCIDKWRCPYIPADEPQDFCAGCGGCGCATCEDGRVEMCEMGGYACAWKKDCNDDLAGMTRAAYIWKGGECYCWDEVVGNWFLATCPAPESGCCGDGGGSALASTGGTASRQFGSPGAVRSLPYVYSPTVMFDVTITINPPDGVLAVALEDQPPEGWVVGSMSEGCELGPESGKVKCGPFFAPDIPVDVTYEVLPPPDASREGCFTGTVSFDGINQPIGGDTFAPLAHYADCMTGPSGGPYDPPCGALDFDFDDDVDLEDFAEFQRIFCSP